MAERSLRSKPGFSAKRKLQQIETKKKLVNIAMKIQGDPSLHPLCGNNASNVIAKKRVSLDVCARRPLSRLPRAAKLSVDYCKMNGNKDYHISNSDPQKKVVPVLHLEKSVSATNQEVIMEDELPAMSVSQSATTFSGCIDTHTPCMAKNDRMNGRHLIDLHDADKNKIMQREHEKSETPPANGLHFMEESIHLPPEYLIPPERILPKSALSRVSKESSTNRGILNGLEEVIDIRHSLHSFEARVDEDQVSVIEIMERKNRKKNMQQQGYDSVTGNRLPLRGTPPTGVVATKLRHFAQASSPKGILTQPKAPTASTGKHLPLAPILASSTSHNEDTISDNPESLMISLPLRGLKMPHPLVTPTTSCTLTLSPVISRPAVSRVSGMTGLQSRKSKRRATALSNFVSKKRAVTHSLSPEILPVNSLESGTCSFIENSQHSGEVTPGKVLSGSEINTNSAIKKRPCLSLRSRSPPIGNGCQEPKELSRNLRKRSKVKEGSAELAAFSRQGVANLMISEDDRLSVASSSTNSTTNSTTTIKRSVLTRDTIEPKNQVGIQPSFTVHQPSSYPFKFDLFKNHFGLTVKDGKLSLKDSLRIPELKKSKFCTADPSHPVWTWKLGESTKTGAPPPFKVRSIRHTSSKVKLV